MVSFVILATIFLVILLIQRAKTSSSARDHAMEKESHQQMLSDSIEFQEKELERIAKDLHDDIGSMLSAAKINIDPEMRKAMSREELLEAMDSSRKMLSETISHVRDISRELMPMSIKKFGLSAAIEDLVSSLRSATHMEIVFQNIGKSKKIDAHKELGIYRIAQELLNNAVKHSEAEKIDVTVEWKPDSLQLIIWDNGKGFDYKNFASKSTFHQGLGLNNIQCRATAINAFVNFHSQQTGGTKIEIGLNL